MTAPNKLSQALAHVVGDAPDFRFYFLSELLHRSVDTADGRQLGRIKDLVVKLATPYPQVIGLLLDHGWGKPHEFVPWERVTDVSPAKLTVQLEADDEPYRPYVDQPGRILLNEHLMGQTILDIDGRRTKMVMDVHLLESKRRMLLVHVDVAGRGFLQRLGFRRKEQLISWRIFHPLTVEDATTDTVMLTVTRKQSKYLASDDLVAALEELKRQEQATNTPTSEPRAESTPRPGPFPVSRDYLAVPRDTPAGEVLKTLRLSTHQPDDITDIFVVSPAGTLEGVVSLSALVLASEGTPVRGVMSAPAATILTQDGRTEVEEKFHRTVARILPVLDERGVLAGIVRHSDLRR